MKKRKHLKGRCLMSVLSFKSPITLLRSALRNYGGQADHRLSSFVPHCGTTADKPITVHLFHFTMVEITLAIAIIGIGMAGVMALLPVGFNATRDAMGDNYSSSMADQFLHVIAQQCKMYNASAADGWDWGDGSHIVGNFQTSKQFTVDTDEPGILDWETDSTKFLFGNIIFRDGAGDDLPDAYDIFRIQQKSGDVVDFQASLRLWKEQITHEGYNLPYTNAVRLCVEISWPIEKLYSMREKKYYSLEIFNNNK